MNGKQKIKIIKIEVGEAPAGFYAPYLERVKPKPLKMNFLSEEVIDPYISEVFEREILPIQRYAWGEHWEEFYIRDEDMDKLEDFVFEYAKQAKLELIKNLQELLGKGGDVIRRDHVMEALLEIKRAITVGHKRKDIPKT